MNQKTDDFHKAKKSLWKIMKTFQKSLIGRYWNRTPYHFTCIAETGKFGNWHFHLLFKEYRYAESEIQAALDETTKKLQMDKFGFELKQITYTPDRLDDYIVKEIKTTFDSRFDSDRFITSHDLFNLPVKSKNQRLEQD